MARKTTNIVESDAAAVLQQRLGSPVQSPDTEGPANASGPITVGGWTKVDNEDLPTKGKFYQEVWVKPFDVKTVREVSSVDPNNALATLKSMCDILSRNCYIIDLQGNKVDGSNLKRADSLSVLLVIRAITYIDDFKLNLTQPATCSVCGKPIEQIVCDGASILEWPAKFDEIASIESDGTIVYNEGRRNWETENDAWKVKIEAEQMKKNPQFLREAEENGLRFAKYILPYRSGIRIVQEGYIDRMEEVKEGKERQYYMGEYHMGKTILRRVQFEHNRWKPANGYCTYIYGMVPAYTTEKYLTKEEVDAKKR